MAELQGPHGAGGCRRAPVRAPGSPRGGQTWREEWGVLHVQGARRPRLRKATRLDCGEKQTLLPGQQKSGGTPTGHGQDSGTQGPPPECTVRPCATWGPCLRATVRISLGMLARAWEGRPPGAQTIWPLAAAQGPTPSASTLVHPAGSSSASEFLMISERHQLLFFQPRVENQTRSQIKGSNVFIRPPGSLSTDFHTFTVRYPV